MAEQQRLSVSRSSRPFDIIVYGATGFTGKKVARYIQESHPKLKLAISGRSQEKLQNVATEIGLTSESVVVAPLDDQNALNEAMGKARVVLACAGPYRHVGIEVVRAAIASQTDYLDLCGEPQFFDDVLAEHETAARASNTLVVSACAFDCVPAELSATLVSQELRRRFGNESPVTGIEIVHTCQGITCANPTTFHAAVDGFHAAMKGELRQSRQAVKEKFNAPKPPARPEEWPRLPKAPGTMPAYHEPTKTHTLKFIGADAAAILASQRYLRLRNPSFYADKPQPLLSVCFGLEEKSSAFKFLAYGSVFSFLARFKWGCDLLHSQPEHFSGGVFRPGGPTDEELATASFATHSTAYGSKAEEYVRAKCSGPEPGYVATPRIIVALALTVLHHRDKLPFEGGVMLPGALFGECSEAYDQLRKEGIVFEVVESSAEPATVSENA